MPEAKSSAPPSHVEKMKAIAASFAHGTSDIKPYFELDKNQIHRIKIKKATNKSGTFRGHPRGGE